MSPVLELSVTGLCLLSTKITLRAYRLPSAKVKPRPWKFNVNAIISFSHSLIHELFKTKTTKVNLAGTKWTPIHHWSRQ